MFGNRGQNHTAQTPTFAEKGDCLVSQQDPIKDPLCSHLTGEDSDRGALFAQRLARLIIGGVRCQPKSLKLKQEL